MGKENVKNLQPRAGDIRDQKYFFELIDLGIDRMGIGYKSTPVVLGVSKEKSGENVGSY